MNVLEQLEADLEAATGGEWEEAPDQSICVPNVWMVADFVPLEADRRHIISAHNRMWLLLTVARALAELPPGFLYSLVKDMRRRGGQVEMQLADAIEAVAKAIAPLMEDA